MECGSFEVRLKVSRVRLWRTEEETRRSRCQHWNQGKQGQLAQEKDMALSSMYMSGENGRTEAGGRVGAGSRFQDG